MKLDKWIPIALVALALLLIAEPAFAQDAAATWKGWVGMGAGLGIGLAAAGGGIGQGLASRAALEGVARNPQASAKILVPLILGLALIESLVIYALVITYFLQDKI